MNSQLRRIGVVSISLGLLIYAGIRAGVASLLLIQALGFIDFPEFQEAIIDVDQFMLDRSLDALVSMTTGGYLVYLAVMSMALFIGALGFLRNKTYASKFMVVFLIMYVALFVNFQVINPKIWHLITCAALFGILMWLQQEKEPSRVKAANQIVEA